MGWKETLHLPATGFPMKADLTRREPDILRRWAESDAYARVRDARRGAPKWVLHDGPPYANGEGHVGTFRNKILKDVTVRFRTMRGFDAPFIPGWDCHGLPIEHNVMKDLGAKAASTPPAEVRKLCRAYAEKYVAVQRDNFARFGVWADWGRPYLTMSPGYEAGILDVWATLLEKGYVTRGLRAIHWCVSCRTALAEAELEYGPATSPSIRVRFPVESDPEGALGGGATSVVIWTTTPWTLPANAAVAVHPKLQYAVVEHDGPDREQRAVVALPLVSKYLEAVKGTDHVIPRVVEGAKLAGIRLRHPFQDRTVPVVLADYVSAEDGTGCVHTAPGHGADDFATGRREGLPVLNPVGPDGVYTAEVGTPSLVGTHVFKAAEPVLAMLRERGALASHETISHSYPHCWRCKKGVIFRATDQWFISVDHDGLRQRALDACENDISWFPRWGKQRISGMLRERPDWCVSRQRVWGVPIPAFYDEESGELHATPEIVRHVRDIVAKDGADAWFTRDAADLLPPSLLARHAGRRFRKENDIFDVWFESGSSWRSVCTEANGLTFPAELYTESQDQHRGWFQSSLLPALAATGKPPFRQCVTHGFFTDDTGDKVSKSKGGMKDLSFEVLTGQIGADVTRLFFAAANYFEDIAISRRLIDPASELYRKIRNTFRFLLGGCAGFTTEDALPESGLLAVDRWAVHACDDVVARAGAAFDEHDFCKAATLLREFMDGDLSAFWLDLVKDRLYCGAPSSREFRSVRTAMAHVASSLVRAWAPILVFTCEEAWEYVPAHLRTTQSVHLEPWPGAGCPDAVLLSRISRVRRVRDEIQRKVDPLRKAGAVGAGADVAVRWSADDADLSSALAAGGDELLEMLGVSEFARDASADGATDLAGLRLVAAPTALVRCERCRRRRADVTVPASGDPLCARCEAWRGQETPSS
ncbi:MAG: Isoleucine--tRNA ligase [Planctomycetes bacterium]|nr:Isoleucine--tRNA ligase [Planctomycetota bacterium]